MKEKELKMDIQDGFDFIIEESGNSSINLRKISWNNREPKLDLRKWSYNEGQERPLKGVTLTHEGADELTGVMVEQGYGNTNRILSAIKNREDYSDSNVDNIKSNNNDELEEYYDPSELLDSKYEEGE